MKRSRRMRAVLAVASVLTLVLVAFRLMDIGRAMPLRTVVLDQRINGAAVDERTKRIFIATGRDDGSGAIDVLDTRSGAISRIIQMRIDTHLHRHDHPVMLVVDTSTNRVFVTRIGNTIGSVSTLDARNGKTLRTFS